MREDTTQGVTAITGLVLGAVITERTDAGEAQLLKTQDEERRRIARELHDSAGQILAAQSMNLSPLASENGKLPSGALKAIKPEVLERRLARTMKARSPTRSPKPRRHQLTRNKVVTRDQISWICVYRSALLGLSNEGRESRITVERLEIGVSLHIQTLLRREAVFDRIPQRLQGLVAFPLMFFDDCEGIHRVASVRMFRAENAALNLDSVALQLFGIGQVAFAHQAVSKVLHGH